MPIIALISNTVHYPVFPKNNSPCCKDLNCMPFVYTTCPLQKCKPRFLAAFSNLTTLLFDFVINTTNVYCMAFTKAKSYWIQPMDDKDKMYYLKILTMLRNTIVCLNKKILEHWLFVYHLWFSCDIHVKTSLCRVFWCSMTISRI